jgi:hypothetical protein
MRQGHKLAKGSRPEFEVTERDQKQVVKNQTRQNGEWRSATKQADPVEAVHDTVQNTVVEREKDNADRLANMRHPSISNSLDLTQKGEVEMSIVRSIEVIA